MNKEPRLRFTDEERSDPALEKPIRKAEKAAARADKAQANIPKKKVRQTVIDPDTGKKTSKLTFEDKKKPPSKVSQGVREAPVHLVAGKLHKEIRETEQDNVGVESAHKSEEAVETGAYLVREGYRSHKLKPYRKAAQAERQLEKANVNVLYQKFLQENPQFASNPLSRWQQKQAIKRQYAAAKHAGQTAGNTAQAASKTGKAARTVKEKVQQAGAFVMRHKKGFLMAGVLFLITCMLMNTMSSCSMMAQSIGSVLSGTTYPSDDPEMLAVEADYAAREVQLQEEIDNIENSHPGYDEYRYDLGMIGHDPHELAAFLSAVLQGYTRQSAQTELARVFAAQYQLTLTEEVEIRYRTETSTDPETGETTSEEVPYADDSSYYLLCALEVIDEDGKLERKADMFTKRTIKPHQAVATVDTASEALAVSISEKACVDMSYMSRLTGKTKEALAGELQGVIFRVPGQLEQDGTPHYVTADEYLSGNVRRKLRQAQRAAQQDPSFAVNVEALNAAQPKDLDASEIEVRLGATWIDKEYIQQFMYETFNTPFYLQRSIEVNYSSFTAEWQIKGKSSVSYNDVAAYTTYGTSRANAYKILEDSLNLRDVRIYDTIEDADGKERRVLNAKETTLAAQKQQAIREAFRDWIWRDSERRQTLVSQYNEEMNSIRPREYDGSHITFGGMNPAITLREHQKSAIAHVLYGGNTLLAHEVGAGKTFEMVAASMEAKRLGLCQKSLFVVPNHLTEQWASEFLRLYPSANILVTTKKDFETHNRKKFCARIATGDYDAIIMGHSQFERIPISRERQERLLYEQIDEITEGIAEVQTSGGERFTVKQLERTRKSLEARLEKLQAEGRKDDVVTFEQLGVDRLFVDEAHNYKNLFLYTKMRNVAGLSTSDAQKSSDMFAKCRYMDEITGNRGVIFATGTPVSNSMTELYTMQRYLQYERLQELNMTHFDCWASRFGETVTALELAPEGTGYRARTRFSKFFNLPELMNLFKEVADIKTADQLNLPTPEVEYHNIVAQPTEHQQEMVKALSERASLVHSGTVDPSQDNMLKITSDGRKLGLDQRIVNQMLPDEPGTKVNQCVDNIMQIWRDGKADKLTQLVFCDISTPQAKAPVSKAAKTLDNPLLHALEGAVPLPEQEPAFTVYDDIRQKLIVQGMPADQIAFIHEANTEVRKKELFSKVRTGQVRVLLGSTAKMGAGTNVQDRLVALHDLDCPWRPGDLAQRKGRIERQGNQNPLVHVYRYVTEGTFDAYLWQTVENKQKFISQIMTSKSPVRSCDDVDETALSFAEIKALCAGDPRIKERMDLDVEVSRLKLMKADHQSKQYRLEDQLLKYFPEEIEKHKGFIKGFESDLEVLTAHPHPEDGFAGMEIRGDLLTDKENAGAALLDACKEVKTSDPVQIGSYRGYAMSVEFSAWKQEYTLLLKGQMTHRATLGTDPRGNLTRIDNALAQMPQRLEAAKAQLDNLYQQQAAAKEEVGKPFLYEKELRSKNARLVELDTLLNIDGKGQAHTESVVAKSTRPSVLGNLKRPVQPRSTDKKPKQHEEVR